MTQVTLSTGHESIIQALHAQLVAVKRYAASWKHLLNRPNGSSNSRYQLGCSREKSGCRRCQSRGEPCMYEPPRHRGKKSQKQSTPSPNRERAHSPRDDPVNASPALQSTTMVPGNTIRATVADSCDQHATVNVSPQHPSADAAKQSAMTESAYSSCSDSDFLSVDFMPELINFSDDVLMPGLSGSYSIYSSPSRSLFD